MRSRTACRRSAGVVTPAIMALRPPPGGLGWSRRRDRGGWRSAEPDDAGLAAGDAGAAGGGKEAGLDGAPGGGHGLPDAPAPPARGPPRPPGPPPPPPAGARPRRGGPP